MTDLLDPIVALVAQWRECASTFQRDFPCDLDGEIRMLNQCANQIDAVLGPLRDRIAQQEKRIAKFEQLVYEDMNLSRDGGP